MKIFGRFSIAKSLSWLMAFALAAVVAGCGGGGDGDGGGAGFGTLGASLTDSPSCGFDAVNVTVVKVRVHQSSSSSDTDAGWTDITLNPPRKIDLLSLTNGVLTSLGEATLPAGHYTQLRLVLDANTGGSLANSVTPTGGVETALATPSAVQSGIKLVHQFDVAAGQRVDVLIDFDACKSIVTRGNGTFALKPVIKIVPYVLNGIKGFVDLASLASSVMVTAQQNGAIIQSSAPNPTTGEFMLARLEPGNYDVVMTANNHAIAVVATVPVASTTSITPISTALAPITLPASVVNHDIKGTVTLNPTSSTAVAFATAKQTFGAAPTVTVKFVAADDLAVIPGTYSLALPADAPRFGLYSATLPIALAAQAGVAGKYAEEASAEGYVTQTFNADITAANVTHSFVLVP